MHEIHCPFCQKINSFSNFKENRPGKGMSLSCKGCFKVFYVFENEADLPIDTTKRAASVLCQKRVAEDEPHFVVLEDEFSMRQVFAIPQDAGEYIVGRKNEGSDADIQLYTSDPSVDRYHFTLVKKGTGMTSSFYVKDNRSRTGTYVNNKEISPNECRRINDGDVLSVGATSIIISIPEDDFDVMH